MASAEDEFPSSHYEGPPLLIALLTYLQFTVLIIFGRLRDFLHNIGILDNRLREQNEATVDFVPLLEHKESFFVRNLYRRFTGSLERPISSTPSAEFDILERKTTDHWSWELTGKSIRAINTGSYNYLGFAENSGYCTDNVDKAIREYGITLSSTLQESGANYLHRQLDPLIAEFVGKEDAITFGMGFATNALNIPALVGPGCCVISDTLNHASLVLGIRLSGAEIKRFEHNDMNDLERCLKESIVYGRKRIRRPFKKLLIVVEGIYSMEGSILNLPAIIRLKKKYKAYLFVDEAHSIGAIGPRGRGVVDYFGCNPDDVDLLMGTFSKSFGSAGGYIAGSRRLIDYLRTYSHACPYGTSMPPPVAKQIISSIKVIMGKVMKDEGLKRLRQLAWNCRYFRRRLHEMRFVVYGHKDSPVVPTMLFCPVNFAHFSKLALDRGVGVVVVGFPAAPLLLCRVRFCLSAEHTKAMLDRVLDVVSDVGKQCNVRVSKWPLPKWVSEPLGPPPCQEGVPETVHFDVRNGHCPTNGYVVKHSTFNGNGSVKHRT